MSDPTYHRAPRFEEAPLYNRMVSAASETRDRFPCNLHISELLWDFGEHARAHPLARVMDRAEIIIEAASLLDQLYNALTDARDVLEGLNDDEINEELLPSINAALSAAEAAQVSA